MDTRAGVYVNIFQSKRARAILHHDVINRWGFLDSSRGTSDHCTMNRIIISSRKTRKSSHPDYFESAKETGGSIEIWPIDVKTVRIRAVPNIINDSDDYEDTGEVNFVMWEVEFANEETI